MAGVTLFRRRCRVVVDTIEVVPLEEDPSRALTVRFRVDKSLTAEPNKAEVHIFNLSPDSRSQLAARADVPVLIEAGYAEGSSCIFLGKLRSVQTVREGADIITSLSSGDGELEYKTGRVSVSVKRNTPTDVALRELAKALGVEEGNLADAVAKIKANALGQMFAAGTVFHGQAARQMTSACRSAGLTWSIQDGKLQFLGLREALKGEAILLTPETGLVDSPTVDPKGVLKARMLMAPDVFPGRLLVLKSAQLEGQYRIEKTTHTGDTAGNDWFVDVEAKRY